MGFTVSYTKHWRAAEVNSYQSDKITLIYICSGLENQYIGM